MKYFKNTELAKLYKVSEKSVRNWIEAAQKGKLELQLFEHNGKYFIANTLKNATIIEQLVERGKKYKNKRGFRVVSPTKKFYRIYNTKQILSIISSLSIHNEVPTEYTYFGDGAKFWDEYSWKVYKESSPNLLNRTIELLNISLDNLVRLIGDRHKVNVIDLGPGNGLPIRPVLEHLQKSNKLQKYIAVDLSEEMLNILERNIKEWFGGKVAFEGRIQNFTYQRFDDLLIDDYARDDKETPINLVFALGGTLDNFRHPEQVLQTINSSMGINDLFIYAGCLDTPHTRRYFDFDTSGVSNKLAPMDRMLVDPLGIEESLYDVQLEFNEEQRIRSISILPKIDLSIQFDFANGSRYVELRKGRPILLWRYWHKDTIEIINEFDQNEFDILQATKSADLHYLLLISKVKTKYN